MRISERVGRKRVLIWGWLLALPIPFIILWAPSWGWIVAANVLLGVNQGFCWSMTVTGKMDIVRADQRGIATGVNEFAGYGAVTLAGLLTGYLASSFNPRLSLFAFGLVVTLFGLAAALLAYTETQPFARAEAARHKAGTVTGPRARFVEGPEHPTSGQIFALITWQNRSFMALSQAGSQLWTGPLSDRIGRKVPIVMGFFICAAGVLALPFLTGVAAWSIAAAVIGVGMALLYPTLIAAMGDIAPPARRGAALGVYRFWRDLGYAIGALAMGLIADASGMPEAGFWFTGIAMAVSGLWLVLDMEETHPRINPAPEPAL